MNTQIVTINGKTGEYTGFSSFNGVVTHYFSMYDGSVIRLASLEGINVIPFESKPLGGQFAYNCSRP